MVSLTDRPDMTLDVYRGRKTTQQQTNDRRSNIGPTNKVVCNSNIHTHNLWFPKIGGIYQHQQLAKASLMIKDFQCQGSFFSQYFILSFIPCPILEDVCKYGEWKFQICSYFFLFHAQF